MIDIVLLVVVLVLANFIAKLDIDKRLYIAVKVTVFITVLLGIIVVLSGSFGSETIISISNSLKDWDIGYPRSWGIKSITFKTEIIGCYYLVLWGVMVMALITSAHEHKDMKRYRDNGKASNIGLVVTGMFTVWIFFYMRASADTGGFTGKTLNHVYNSEVLLLGWSLIWLILASYYGKSLRVIFR